MKKVLFLLLLIAQSFSVYSSISIGEWRTHFSYNNANQVVYADGKVYVEANNKLFSYSNTGEIETFSTLTGLNGNNIISIAWCKPEKTLIIIYSDGNIDFLTKSGLINLPDFKNKSLTADKTIFGIRVLGSKAYISTGVGLLVVDVSRHEISNSYYLSMESAYTKVYDATAWGDTVVVATETGLYAGNTTSNLLDASSWLSMPFISGTEAKKIIRFNDELLVLASNGNIYRKKTSDWTTFLINSGATQLFVQDGYLFVCAVNQTYMYNSSFELQNVESIQNNGIALDPDHNILYIASGKNGLTKLSKTDSKYIIVEDSIMANGPASNVAWRGFFKDGVYYATAGGQAKNWGDRAFNSGDILVFDQDKWSNFKNKQALIDKTGVPFMDFLNIASDPKDKSHYFITSWGDGLYEFRDSVFYKLYTNKNSPLESAAVGDSSRYIRVDGATFDPDGNLWVLNSRSENPIKILKKKKTGGSDIDNYTEWSTINYPDMPFTETWNSILFTKRNQIWMNSMREPAGVFVLDNNNTLEVTSDDKTTWITSFTDQEGNSLSPYYINCITEDLNGIIWIGTVFGPFVVNNPSNVFENDFNITRIKIPRNDGTGLADYLLNDIRITCIAIDGANRKWIGTNGNGLYLLSPDGLVTIHHFDTKNSPLTSNYIWSITIDPETGEAFIGSESGLVSYRSDAIQGKENYGKVYVFPNPVKPEYTGKITVTGLMENTQVRITDLAGNAMISGTSLGGQFSWDGYSIDGKRAASGVYLVFCASEDGTESQACKFMIVN